MDITILRGWAGMNIKYTGTGGDDSEIYRDGLGMELKSTGIGGDDSEIYVNGRGVNEIYGDRCALV